MSPKYVLCTGLQTFDISMGNKRCVED